MERTNYLHYHYDYFDFAEDFDVPVEDVIFCWTLVDKDQNATNLFYRYDTSGTSGKSADPADSAPAPVVERSPQNVTVDGKAVTPDIYNIDGNNYFQLRELGTALGFGVDYDAATNTAIITTK